MFEPIELIVGFGTFVESKPAGGVQAYKNGEAAPVAAGVPPKVSVDTLLQATSVCGVPAFATGREFWPMLTAGDVPAQAPAVTLTEYEPGESA